MLLDNTTKRKDCCVGIIVPTMNRPEFIIRMLNFYGEVNSPHVLYIGDSSTPEKFSIIKDAVESINNRIKVNLYSLPEMNDRQAIYYLSNQVKEKYCAFTGDDDILLPFGLIECAKFLKNNMDYRTAQGSGLIFSLNNNTPYGSIEAITSYNKYASSEHNSASNRVAEFSSNYWTPQFSVHRTDEYIDDMSEYKNITNKNFGELIVNYASIAKGKSRYIDCNYLIRQDHALRYILPNQLEWFLSESWKDSYLLFINSISRRVSDVDGVDAKKAKESFKDAFIIYLNQMGRAHDVIDCFYYPKKIIKIALHPLYRLYRTIYIKYILQKYLQNSPEFRVLYNILIRENYE